MKANLTKAIERRLNYAPGAEQRQIHSLMNSGTGKSAPGAGSKGSSAYWRRAKGNGFYNANTYENPPSWAKSHGGSNWPVPASQRGKFPF